MCVLCVCVSSMKQQDIASKAQTVDGEGTSMSEGQGRKGRVSCVCDDDQQQRQFGRVTATQTETESQQQQPRARASTAIRTKYKETSSCQFIYFIIATNQRTKVSTGNCLNCNDDCFC